MNTTNAHSARSAVCSLRGLRLVLSVRAVLYQLRYEASLEAGQVRVQFIPIIYEENDMMYIMIKII